jgi:hypothetical protein
MPLSKSALAAVFKRSGSASAHTTLYDDAPAKTQQFAKTELLRAGVGGEPILMTMFSPDEWSVVTTRELLATQNGETRLVSADEVYKVTPVWNEDQFRKTELDTLQVLLRDGTTLMMRTDSGQAFSGLWNVLKSFEAQTSNGRVTT